MTTGGEVLLDDASPEGTEPGEETDIAPMTTGPASVRLPRVSVVVPTFNNALYIDSTIHSILSQTYTDFELIVSDHSSTDGTWERLQAVASDLRIKLMRLPRGGGALANWDAVTQRARGEFVKLVCGDDILYPTSLAEQVAAFDQHPDAVLVASQRDIVDETGVAVVRGRGVQHLHGLVDGRQAVRRSVRAGTNVFGEPACVLMRRQVLLDSGGWDSRSPFLLDQATYSRVLMHGPMVALRRPLAGFRISASQWSVSLSREQSEHARAFHRRISYEYQGLLTRSDVQIGDARATLMEFKRRAAYFWLRQRMGR
jgi:glycosyltransferase involved in cell wall biosynthesis